MRFQPAYQRYLQPNNALTRTIHQEIWVSILDQWATQSGQLEAKDLILKRGTVVDAAIMESSTCPLSKERGKELAENPSAQIDTDADSTFCTPSKGGVDTLTPRALM